MWEDIQTAVEQYNAKWRAFVSERQDRMFFEELRPVAVGWKVATEDEYKAACDELQGRADLVIQTWMNGRWIAKVHLRDDRLDGGIQIIKIMQRRPGSEDALGLDHIDFYGPRAGEIKDVLTRDNAVEWTVESNDHIADYNWVSVWFSGYEAKIKDYTVLRTISGELISLEEKIIAA